MRVALYARVSTEEQAKHGISIDAQLDALRAWAKAGSHEIVGEYVDAGISGKKPFQKRPELLRFIQQLDAGLSVDALVFCKLDRFYRSVKLYYQAVDIFERHKVAWIAIQEDYETVTASGRFKVNIMLSVAENEADRTSERIKSVFEHKVNMGQAITNALPLGLRIDGKKLVPDEYAPAALAAFEHYAIHGNKSAVRDMLQDRYGFKFSVSTISKMLRNKLYIGEYRGNKQYCEPIVPRELFDRVQHDLESRTTRKTPSGRVYLFSGLIVCKNCGRRMCSIHCGEGRDYYRCSRGHTMLHDCDNPTYIREIYLEDAALNQLSGLVAGQTIEYKPKQKSRPAVNKAAIQRKLDRLKELYIDGDISKEKYRQQRDELTSKLTMPEEKPSQLIKIVGSNFLAEYAELDREKKKQFWRSVIDRVEVSSDGVVDVFFMQ